MRDFENKIKSADGKKLAAWQRFKTVFDRLNEKVPKFEMSDNLPPES
jgi:hypothetical protein